jgi:hypothetical protein
LRNLRQPPKRAGQPPMASLVFSHGPSRQSKIKLSQHRSQCRPMIPAIVVDPSSDNRIHHRCYGFYCHRGSYPKPPASYGVPDTFQGFRTYCRHEPDKDNPILFVPQFPCTKLVSKKGKLRLRIFFFSAPILTIDDFRLLWMYRQSSLF